MIDTQLIDLQGYGFVSQQFAKIGCTVNEYSREVGVDAIVEIRDSPYKSSGAFIGVQLKSGMSFFDNEKEDYFSVYIDHDHINYWLKSLLPILFVIFNPDQNEAYWVKIEKSSLSIKKSSYRIDIPKGNKLSRTEKREIYSVVFGKIYSDQSEFESVESELVSLVSTQGPVRLYGIEMLMNGLIEKCTQLYFNIDIPMELSDIKACQNDEGIYTPPDWSFYEKYFKILNYHNLITGDFSFEANFTQQTEMLPMFIKPLSLNGLKFVDYLEDAGYEVRDRGLVRMSPSSFDEYLYK